MRSSSKCLSGVPGFFLSVVLSAVNESLDFKPEFPNLDLKTDQTYLAVQFSMEIRCNYKIGYSKKDEKIEKNNNLIVYDEDLFLGNEHFD